MFWYPLEMYPPWEVDEATNCWLFLMILGIFYPSLAKMITLALKHFLAKRSSRRLRNTQEESSRVKKNQEESIRVKKSPKESRRAKNSQG